MIDAPKLKYLRLDDLRTVRFVRNNPRSIVMVDISIRSKCFQKGVDPNDLQKRQMIRNFLDEISGVQDMFLWSHTLKDMYIYLMQEPLPQFRNLFNMHARFFVFRWKDWLAFLKSFPNLKSLVLRFFSFPKKWEHSSVSIPQCFILSLEFVELENPILGDLMEMKLVSYFLENSENLKKLTLRLDGRMRGESVILKELNDIPRLSSTCEIVIVG